MRQFLGEFSFGCRSADSWQRAGEQACSAFLSALDESSYWALPATAPEEMRSLRSFGAKREKVFPFDRKPHAIVAEAPRDLLELPDLEVTYGEGLVRLRITPTMEDANVGMFFPVAAVSEVETGGRSIPIARPAESDPPTRGIRITAPGEAVEITLRLTSDEGFDAWVFERRSALPEGDDLVPARPAYASAIHDCDRTVAMRTIRVQPSRR